MVDPVAGTFFAATVLGAVSWGLRLEGRVDKQDSLAKQKHDDLKELMKVHFESLDRRLERIERSLNGHLVRD
jgi:hypothetical protein